MSKPFEWKDFTKKYSDLSSNNFPTLSKAKQVQDTIKFKFSSKAQEGVKFDSSVTNYDASTTEADFSSKLNLDEVKGLELGFKAKSKPSTEFTAKLNDQIIPLEGSSLTLKLAAAASSDQTIGAAVGYANQYVNLNLGFSYGLTHPLIDFVKADDLAKQKNKIDVDFVVKPSQSQDIHVGGNASIALAKGEDPFLYNSKLGVVLNNKGTNAGFSVEHEKKNQKS